MQNIEIPGGELIIGETFTFFADMNFKRNVLIFELNSLTVLNSDYSTSKFNFSCKNINVNTYNTFMTYSDYLKFKQQ